MISQKRWRKALKCFLRLRAEEEGNLKASGEAKLKATLGKIYYHIGDFKSAIAELDGVSSSMAYYYLGRIYADQNRPGMALQQLEKIQSLDTNITALKLMRDLQKDLGMVEAEKQTLQMLFDFNVDREERLKVLDRLLWIAEYNADHSLILQVLKLKREIGFYGIQEMKKAAGAIGIRINTERLARVMRGS